MYVSKVKCLESKSTLHELWTINFSISDPERRRAIKLRESLTTYSDSSITKSYNIRRSSTQRTEIITSATNHLGLHQQLSKLTFIYLIIFPVMFYLYYKFGQIFNTCMMLAVQNSISILVRVPIKV